MLHGEEQGKMIYTLLSREKIYGTFKKLVLCPSWLERGPDAPKLWVRSTIRAYAGINE